MAKGFGLTLGCAGGGAAGDDQNQCQRVVAMLSTLATAKARLRVVLVSVKGKSERAERSLQRLYVYLNNEHSDHLSVMAWAISCNDDVTKLGSGNE